MELTAARFCYHAEHYAQITALTFNQNSYEIIEMTKNNLKMKQMINHLDEVIDFTTKNNLSFVDALIKLTTHEIAFKESNMIKSMVKVGAFPHQK